MSFGHAFLLHGPGEQSGKTIEERVLPKTSMAALTFVYVCVDG